MVVKLRWTLTVILLLVLVAATASAQSRVSGSVQGVVKDADGAAIPGVTVTVASPALITGKLVTVSDDRGVYRFPSLPVGTYSVEASLSGFKTVKREGLRVTLSQALAVDFSMEPAVSEAITVTAEAPVLSTVNNTVATNFDETFLERQPLPRNFYNIIKAAPGVNADYTSSSGSAMLAYGSTSESFSAPAA